MTIRLYWRAGIASILIAVTAVAVGASPRASAAPEDSAPSGMDLHRELDFREEFGFSTDRAQLSAAWQDPGRDASRASFGAALTADERQEMARRIAVQRAAGELQQELAMQFPSAFGGLYVDQRRGGRVVAYAAANLEQVRDHARGRFQYRDELDVLPASVPIAHLEALLAKVSSDSETLSEEGVDISLVKMDVRGNQVIVGVSGDPEHARAVIRRHYPGERLAVELATPQVLTSADSDYPPLKGGTTISTPLTNRPGFSRLCSSAFFLERLQNRDPLTGVVYPVNEAWLVTAAHCVRQVPSTWSHFLYSIGTSNNDGTFGDFNANRDIAVFPLDRPTDKSNRLRLFGNGSSTTYQRIYGYQRSTQDVVGAWVCRAGRRLENWCGTISSTNATVTYNIDGIQWRIVSQRITTAPSCPGDSGGAVYDGTLAVGVMSGTTNASGCDAEPPAPVSTNDAIYSHIDFEIREDTYAPQLVTRDS